MQFSPIGFFSLFMARLLYSFKLLKPEISGQRTGATNRLLFAYQDFEVREKIVNFAVANALASEKNSSRDDIASLHFEQ
ncbi:MAG: hypothetical protein J6C44_07155 [Muribaculaceae bacterium]|nr:hypothetical protein [Muribaculaceae bacterium]